MPTRRRGGRYRPQKLLEDKRCRDSGGEYHRPEHVCGNCKVSTTPRWYRMDEGHICVYCYLYQQQHDGEPRPQRLEEERRAKGLPQVCRNCGTCKSRNWFRVVGSASRECTNCKLYRQKHGRDRPPGLERYRDISTDRICSHSREAETVKWHRTKPVATGATGTSFTGRGMASFLRRPSSPTASRPGRGRCLISHTQTLRATALR